MIDTAAAGIVAEKRGEGVKIGLRLATGEPHHGRTPRFRDIRADAVRAERDGFDSVWIMDHLVFEEPDRARRGVWEAWTVLAAVAERTERVELGTLVLAAAFRNPALTAKMADTLAEVSGGRLILGLGAGWREPEFTAFGYSFAQLGDQFEESLRITAALLRTGTTTYAGTHARAIDCELRPRGPRPNGPPILIGASRPRLLRLTAELADAWNTCWVGRAVGLAEPQVMMREACKAVGRDPSTLGLTVGQQVTFPGFAPDYEIVGGLDEFRFSGPDDLAAEWRAFSDLGVDHLIVWSNPHQSETLDLVTEALRMYRHGLA
jgi:alkanesulfonate monooxygenase SsuD/methylene tetrahydromethanopterin reductase-like flavin-dependent oxidoreductase (luciferase family)